MKQTAAAAAIILLAHTAGAVCLGDFNGNDQVEIGEIIISVNNLLNGCQDIVPTPAAACPINFSDDNSAADASTCYYVGRWNPNCGKDDLQARWTSSLGGNTDPSDDVVVVELLGFDPPVFFGAAQTSPTFAELIGWFRTQDASDLMLVSGALALGDGGRTLVLSPCAVPFTLENCDVTRYDGALTDVQPGTGAIQASVRLQVQPVLARLRAARAARQVPNLQRK